MFHPNLSDDREIAPPQEHAARSGQARGFTLLEGLIAVAILGVVAAIAIPMYADYQERVRVQRAVTDIGAIAAHIKHYYEDNRGFPPDLAAVGAGATLDPWGNAYEYTDLTTKKGQARKDKNLVPINSDFDLYSKGKDGASVGPHTAPASRDDIIRAADGRFIGLAKEIDP
jgi:general secretion pathway protein G